MVSAAAARGGEGDVVTGGGDGVVTCEGGGVTRAGGLDSAVAGRGGVDSGIERYGGRAGGSMLRRLSGGAGRVWPPGTLAVERDGAVEPGAAVGARAAVAPDVVAEVAGGGAAASRRGRAGVSWGERAGWSAGLGASGFSGAVRTRFSRADPIDSVEGAGALVSGATGSGPGAGGGSGAGDDDGTFAA